MTFLIGKLRKDNGFLIHMYSATIEMIFLNSTVLGHNTGLVDGTSSECIANIVATKDEHKGDCFHHFIFADCDHRCNEEGGQGGPLAPPNKEQKLVL